MSNENSTEVDEIWAVYGEESRENLEQVEACLLKLEKDPLSSAEISAMFRAVHTLKGSSRMMGLNALESLAHRSEDLVSLLREQKLSLNPELVGLLLSVVDCLGNLLEQSLANRSDPPEPGTSRLNQQLDSVITKGCLEDPSSDCRPCQELAASGASPRPEEEGDSEIFIEAVEQIDFSTDPASVRIFFDMADEELRRITSAVPEAAAGDPAALERLSQSADSLQFAASQMGYQSVATILGDWTNSFQESPVKARDHILPMTAGLQDEIERLRRTYPYLAEMDPSADLFAQKEPEPVEADREQEPDPRLEAEVISFPLVEVLERIGELVGEQAIMHRAISRLEQMDVMDAFTRILRDPSGNPEKFKAEFTPVLAACLDQAAVISRAEKRIAASLNQLHETVRAQFHSSLPFQQSIIDGMVIRIGKVFYIIAISSIRRILSKDVAALSHSSADGNETLLRLEDELLPVVSLSKGASSSNAPLLIVIEGESQTYVLEVDEIIGQQNATILPIPPNLAKAHHALGCVILGDQEIGVVLDTNRVIEN